MQGCSRRNASLSIACHWRSRLVEHSMLRWSLFDSGSLLQSLNIYRIFMVRICYPDPHVFPCWCSQDHELLLCTQSGQEISALLVIHSKHVVIWKVETGMQLQDINNQGREKEERNRRFEILFSQRKGFGRLKSRCCYGNEGRGHSCGRR